MCSFEIFNPNQATDYNCLRVIETRGSTTVSNQYLFNAASGPNPACWDLSLANGQGLQRCELTTNGAVRTETVSIFKTNTSPVIRKKVQKFQTFAFGERMTEKSVDPGGNERKVTYSYDTNPAVKGVKAEYLNS